MIITGIVSYRGLRDNTFFDRYKFEVGRIQENKEYVRLVTSGFLHISWGHLIMNFIALYFFGSTLERSSLSDFLFIYFASLIGGGLFALLIHKNHPDYSSVGASGAISGLIFAFIAIKPTQPIGILFLPISIPAWIFGLLYMAFSIYAIRSQRDNIGHDAHLGGGIVGMLLALLIHPSVIAPNFVYILLVLLPAIIFIIVIIKKPHALLVQNMFYENHQGLTIDDRYNINRNQKKQELDRILEKIHARGISSLSKKERQILDELSND